MHRRIQKMQPKYLIIRQADRNRLLNPLQSSYEIVLFFICCHIEPSTFNPLNSYLMEPLAGL